MEKALTVNGQACEVLWSAPGVENRALIRYIGAAVFVDLANGVWDLSGVPALPGSDEAAAVTRFMPSPEGTDVEIVKDDA